MLAGCEVVGVVSRAVDGAVEDVDGITEVLLPLVEEAFSAVVGSAVVVLCGVEAVPVPVDEVDSGVFVVAASDADVVVEV